MGRTKEREMCCRVANSQHVVSGDGPGSCPPGPGLRFAVNVYRRLPVGKSNRGVVFQALAGASSPLGISFVLACGPMVIRLRRWGSANDDPQCQPRARLRLSSHGFLHLGQTWSGYELTSTLIKHFEHRHHRDERLRPWSQLSSTWVPRLKMSSL